MSNLATIPPSAPLVRVNPFEPGSIPEALQLSEMLAKSALVPQALRGKPADIFIVLATARELGIGPMQGLSDINVIQGKPVYSADLMVAQCKHRGEVCRYIRLVESTEAKATYETQRVGSPEPERFTFTIEDAKRLGLTGKDNYQKQPKTMLRRRAAAALAREVYPDLVRGYDPDEVEDVIAPTPAGAPQPEAPKELPAQAESLKDRIAAKLAPALADRVLAIHSTAKGHGITKEGLAALVLQALGAAKPNRAWTEEDCGKIEGKVAEFVAASEKHDATLEPGSDPESMQGEEPDRG